MIPQVNLDDLVYNDGDHGASFYSDRCKPPAETVAAVRPFMAEFGVTRLARVTGLDCVGIPVWSAIRPDSRTLAQSQGKGVDDDAAQASALMEAIEVACAERADLPAVRGRARDFSAEGVAYETLDTLLRRGATAVGDDEEIEWVAGLDIISGDAVMMPREAIILSEANVERRFWQSTDGLASGNTLWEAVLHGLCERIERDAMTLWLLRDDDDVMTRCIDPSAFGDAALDRLRVDIERAGLELRLFDATCDTGAPVFGAFIFPSIALAGEKLKYFDLSSGWGCHPSAIRAAIRAVTEAAQTRLTTISAARDDFDPAKYRERLHPSLEVYLMSAPQPRPEFRYAAEPPRSEYLPGLVDGLQKAGVGAAIVVPFETGKRGFAVARTVVPDLEEFASRRSRTKVRTARARLRRGQAVKVAFVGPSLFGLVVDGRVAGFDDVVCRPPAAQGDVARAVLDGAEVIGLIDGRYEDVAAPWHKELLFALSEGVAVYGGASLGALRAVECAPYGMIGVGRIFARYAAGELIDDSDVAQLHAPEELGSAPVTEAFVNVEATIKQAADAGELARGEAAALIALAREIFFKNLTFEALAEHARRDASEAADLLAALERHRVDQKRLDALELMQALADAPPRRVPPPQGWRLAEPKIWLDFLAKLKAERGGAV